MRKPNITPLTPGVARRMWYSIAPGDVDPSEFLDGVEALLGRPFTLEDRRTMLESYDPSAPQAVYA